MSVKNKVALITGSTSGIGLGIAQEFAKSGINVMLNGFGEYKAAQSTIESLGARAGYHGADLTKPTEIEDLIKATLATFGGIDILVNNAGIQHVAPVEEFSVERWDTIIALNLTAAFHTIRQTLPQMKERKFGRIINIASIHGLVASTGKAAYVAAKHGLLGLTKTVALETATTNITCNAICPGWVHTPLVQAQIDARATQDGIPTAAAQHALLSEKQPSGKFVTTAQIGQMALFLCSDAAQEMRGFSWAVDGGWTAQ